MNVRGAWLGAIRNVVCAAAISQLCVALPARDSGASNPAKSQITPPITKIDVGVRNDVLRALARELESGYAIESTANKLAALVTAKRKANAYKNITLGPEFARALTRDLYTVAHDKHLHVNFSLVPLPQGPAGPPSKEMLEKLRKLNGSIPKVEILDGNVGYMRVNGVPPVEAAHDAVAAAFAFLHNTDALIVDDRENGGGDPNTVALYVSYLSQGESYVVNTFHWRAGNRVEEFRTTDLSALSYGAHKPVFVLTSAATFSGGEELAYDLQVLKRALIVGAVTGGGANPGGPVPLGHQFTVALPGGQAVNPITGTSWEGVGIQPDIAVPAETALGKAHALAVDRLAADASDPMQRSALNAVAMKLQSIAEADSGSASRLANGRLVGTYAPPVGPGLPVTILEKDGRLVQHIDGFPDVELVFLKGNRYRCQGCFPEGWISSFRDHDGRTELLLESPVGTPRLLEHQ